MAWQIAGTYFETCSCDVVCPCTASLALGGVFSGALGGPMAALGPLIGENLGVERAPIEVDHQARNGWFRAGEYVTVRVGDPVAGQEPVTCVIPGHDRKGTERHGELLSVSDGPLGFELSGRCAYQSTFYYSS